MISLRERRRCTIVTGMGIEEAHSRGYDSGCSERLYCDTPLEELGAEMWTKTAYRTHRGIYQPLYTSYDGRLGRPRSRPGNDQFLAKPTLVRQRRKRATLTSTETNQMRECPALQ